MLCSTIRVKPDERFRAEVVVLLTTLGAKRTEYNAGRRARDLLEIKRAHHKIVDFNRDARQAGTGEAEIMAINKLMQTNKLQTGEDDDLILPQVFVDGFYIGDAVTLQGLEDDNVLDSILSRTMCVSCGATREPSSMKCSRCSETFEEIMPGKMLIQDALDSMEEPYDDEEDYEDEGEDDEWEDAEEAQQYS